MPAHKGIYKITNPSGRVYIGQSVDIKKRFNYYNCLRSKNQRKLYNSFLKYGVINHKFEILQMCEISELNELERYYQEMFNCVDNGLNCRATKTGDKSGELSEETKQKISVAHKGRKFSEEHKKKLSLSKQNMTEEYKQKLRIAKLGKKVSDETKKKMADRMKGNSYTKGMRPINARRVVCSQTGNIFDSIKEAAFAYNIRRTTLGAMLSGIHPNKTNLVYN